MEDHSQDNDEPAAGRSPRPQEDQADDLDAVEMDMSRSSEEDNKDDNIDDGNNDDNIGMKTNKLDNSNNNYDDHSNGIDDAVDDRHDRQSRRHHRDHQVDDFRSPDDLHTSNHKQTITNDISNIIHVTNISPSASLEQVTTLFGSIGDIVDIALFHYDNSPETNFKVCFVEYSQHSSVLIAQHLTNTIFIDRALFILPYNKLKIPPDKETAQADGYGDTEYVTHFNEGVVTQIITGPGGAQVITTTDPRLTSLGLQSYPQLPINTDPTRLEEIRRTLYIGNLDSTLSPEQVLKFFNDMGEVKYIRIAGDDTQPSRFAFVEFTHQASIANALQYNGFVLGSRALKINHSNNPIVKPNIKLDIDSSASARKSRDNRSTSRDGGSRDGRHHSSSRRDRTRDRYYDRRRRNSRSRRSRSRDRDVIPRHRRSRSRDHTSRRSRSRDDLTRRRSRSRDSRKRRSRSRSGERRPKHKSSSRRR